MKVTAYNEFGMKDASRVVCGYNVDEINVTKALDKAVKLAHSWNKTEKRDNMKVKFVVAGGKIRNV